MNVNAFLGRAYVFAGRDADAIALWARTKHLIPFRGAAHRVEYYLGRGDDASAEEALREMERIRPESGWTLTYRGILTARRGDPEQARRVIARLEEQGRAGELTPFFEGFVHFALGEQDRFVECLEGSLRLHSPPHLELLYAQLYAPARQDPRVLDILRLPQALVDADS